MKKFNLGHQVSHMSYKKNSECLSSNDKFFVRNMLFLIILFSCYVDSRFFVIQTRNLWTNET